MTLTAFTYCVIRYMPDPGADERLNIGVLVFSKTTAEIYWRFEERYERLSSTFAGFNGKVYRAQIARLGEALASASAASQRPMLHDSRYQSAVDVLTSVISDEGLCLNISKPRSGITDNLRSEMNNIFDRMVVSRRATKPELQHRTDEQLWRSVFEPRLPPDVRAQLQPKTFQTSDVEVSFEHAFKNGAWHVVQPISFDYKTVETVRKRASEWAGTSLGLQNAAELGKIYFVLGAPEDPAVFAAYDKAKRLLDKAPVKHEIIEEKDAAHFAEALTAVVRHTE